ncbi:serine/threonine-protein kinase [Streptomyces sp. NPDC004980]
MEGLKPTDPRQVGRYRIVGLLGAGGMGRVFLGRSPSGRLVAVKVVRPELADDPGFRRRFVREVAAARKVTGFFTAALVDADPDGSPPWLATAYVPGMALDEALAAHGPWQVDSVRALGAGLAEALEAVHSAGLIHRDLKPSNVIIAPDGPRVVDFGISVAVEATVLTRAGTIVGTPGFMAPEQLTGRPVTPATDVFALGAVLTYAATGTGPFGTGSAQSLNFRIAYEEPQLGRLPGPGLEIIARCLAKDPDLRPEVGALIEELAEAANPSGYTPTEIVTDGTAWLPDQVARALSATVTAAAASSVPELEAAPQAAPRPPARSRPEAARPAVAPSVNPAGPPATTRPRSTRPAAGAAPKAPRPRKAPTVRAAHPSPGVSATAPAAPAWSTSPWAVRRILLLSVAFAAFVLSVCLPFRHQQTALSSPFDVWSVYPVIWPFGGVWPIPLTAALAVGSCAGVLSALRRFPDPVPHGVRRLHVLITALTAGLLVLYVGLGLGARGNLSFLGSGAWFFVLGCVALVSTTFRLSGPKSTPAP